MADESKGSKGSKLSVLDTVLISGAVVAGVLIALWIFRAVVGLALLAFKIVVLVVIVAVVLRLVHFFRRHGD